MFWWVLKMFLDILVILVILAVTSNCDTKVWIYNNDIYNAQNWKGGKTQKDCSGLVFAEINRSPVFINKLNVKQLVLPETGLIYFEEGSEIEFDEQSQDDLNCVELNPTEIIFYDNVTGWANMDNPNNPAIPYAERPPCRYDDVVIPEGFNSSIFFDFEDVLVRSVTFGNEKLTQDELNALFKTDVGQEVFNDLSLVTEDEKRILFKITGEDCRDPAGCDRRGVHNKFWPPRIEEPNLQCTDSIVPYANFEIPICGAQIEIKNLKHGFTLERINKKLKEYRSYTHASKYDPERKIQIIFTETEFTGSSIIEATEFYNILQKDDSYFCDDITLKTSGPPLFEKYTQIKSAFSIVFGTLFGVILMFGLLFLAYSPTVRNLNLRNRLLSRRPLSTYILRYDNIDDGANVTDGQSIAGSVVSLNQSFENPMFEQAPMTTSSSNETVITANIETEIKELNNETKNENAGELDSAQEVENIDLQQAIPDEGDEVLLKDL